MSRWAPALLGLVLVLEACGVTRIALTDTPTTLPSEQAQAVTRWLEDHRTGTDWLRRALYHSDPAVRSRVALALGRNEDAEASLPHLFTRLRDESDPTVRRALAFAVGQLGDASGEPLLLAAMTRERHPGVRAEQWSALGRIGGGLTLAAAAQAPEEERLDAVRSVAHAQGRIPDKAALARFAEQDLESTDPERRAAALYVLARAPAELAVSARVQEVAGRALVTGQPAEREVAVRLFAKRPAWLLALERAPDASQVFGALGSVLSSEERAALAGPLGTVATQESRDLLVRWLSQAVASLNRRRSTLVDGETKAALAAAAALVAQQRHAGVAAPSVDVLHTMLAALPAPDPASARRKARLRCLLALVSGAPTTSCTPLERVHALAPTDATRLSAALAHPDAAVRLAAVDIVARGGPEPHVRLKSLLDDPDGPVAAAAAEALAALPHRAPELGPTLTRRCLRAISSHELEVALSLLGAMKTIAPTAANDCAAAARATGHLALVRAAREVLGGPLPPRVAVPESLSLDLRVTEEPTHVEVTTDAGTFTLRLDAALAPRTVSHLRALIARGFYDGLTFHRVVPGFVVQGGDPRGDGWGGSPGTLRCENGMEPYLTGTVGIALAGKDTGTSQWFVTLGPMPHLFGTYPVVGRVVRGMEVVLRLVEGDRMTLVRLSP